MEKLSHSERLLNFARQSGVFSSVDVKDWGSSIYCLNADRRIRELCNEGRIKRLNEDEIDSLNLRKEGRSRIGWYTYCG